MLCLYKICQVNEFLSKREVTYLEMFWFIDKETAYGGRAAIIPLLSAILRVHGRKFNEVSIQESCDIGCKDSLAVFFRSASLITHSRKIRISNL